MCIRDRWSDNHDGLAFVIKTGASGRGRINSSYSATGWVQVTGTWDGATGEMKMYANGVLLGTDNFAGDGQLVDTGNNMFIGRDNNAGYGKFEGTLDEFRIYNRVLSIEEINAKRCGELTPGSETGLLIYYDFDGVGGSTVTNQANPGTFDGTVSGDPGNVTFSTATITCIDAGIVNNSSCDVANPNGSIDVSGNITPAGTYEYRLYDGFSIAGSPLQTNATGIFSSLG